MAARRRKRRPSGATRPRIALAGAGGWVVAAALTWILVGLIFERPHVTALGCLPLVVLSWAWGRARGAQQELAARAAVRVVRASPAAEPRGRLLIGRERKGRRSREDEPRVSQGQNLRIPVEISLIGRVPIKALELRPVASAPLEATLVGDGSQRVLTLRSQRIGDVWLHGFEVDATVAGGLFRVAGWVSLPLRVVVLPRHFPMRSELPLQATRASLQEQAGITYTRRRGLGLEIRELRDHQPGDPFKHIAWRATARRGKLITREFESDLVLSSWVLVDASPSMFWGMPGRARIDYAIEVAHNLLQIIIGHGDQAGLLVHDDRVLLQVSPGTGREHLMRLVDALIEIPQLVHESRTEVTERELAWSVARWFEVQRNERFALPRRMLSAAEPLSLGLDEARLARRAGDHLDALMSSRARKRPSLPLDAYALDPQQSLLRAFCRHVGIHLPLDPTPRPGAQAHGLEAAIHTVLRSRGGPHAIVSISDFYTADDLETLRRVALAARRRRHSMVVFCPSDPAFEPPAPQGDRLQRASVEVARLRVHQNLTNAQAVLRPAGVRFLRCGPQDVVPRLLQRLRQVA